MMFGWQKISLFQWMAIWLGGAVTQMFLQYLNPLFCS